MGDELTINFNLVVGVEGSGHHLLRSLLKNFLESENVVDKGDYHPLFEQRWVHPSPRLPLKGVRNVLKRIRDAYAARGVTHCFEDTSIPYGIDRNPLNRMDLVDLVDLLDGLFEVQIVVIYRDPVSSVYSCLRRGFSNSTSGECRLTENSHLYIRSQIEALGPCHHRVVRFEDLITHPQKSLETVMDHFGINRDFAVGSESRIRPFHQRRDIPPDTCLDLDDFFTPLRRRQWEDFYAGSASGASRSINPPESK